MPLEQLLPLCLLVQLLFSLPLLRLLWHRRQTRKRRSTRAMLSPEALLAMQPTPIASLPRVKVEQAGLDTTGLTTQERNSAATHIQRLGRLSQDKDMFLIRTPLSSWGWVSGTGFELLELPQPGQPLAGRLAGGND